jgi:hypothetical protein
VDPGRVQPSGPRVDMRRDRVGAHDMAGKGVELGRAIAEEESERHRRKWVAIGVVGGVGEDHFCGFDSDNWEKVIPGFKCGDVGFRVEEGEDMV